MFSTSILKILLLIFVAFALIEIVFIVQRYGFPQIDLFKPKPGSCKILEEKFCSGGIFFEHKSIKYVAFKNLPSKTTLFSLVDGQRTIIDPIKDSIPPSPFQGFSLLSIYTSDRSTVYTFIGKISLNDTSFVKKGQKIGSILQSSKKIFGDYDLIFTATRKDASGNPMIDEKGMKELFPKIK